MKQLRLAVMAAFTIAVLTPASVFASGPSWAIQASVNPAGATTSPLQGVSCSAATACTAVGYYINTKGANLTLAERWNGTSWAIQATPNPGGAQRSELLGVSCSAATACTAVGF
jgi:hypothetical protein